MMSSFLDDSYAFLVQYGLILYLGMLVIPTGWTNVNEDDDMVFLHVGQVETRTRYRPIFILLGLGTLWMWQQMSDQCLLTSNSSGKGSRSIENTFRVTPIVTLSYVSGGSHVLVSL